MLRNDRSELDYNRLTKRAKRLGSISAPPIKLALLADVSTQHLVPLLRVLLADHNVDAKIYEAGYDTVELEALNPNSGLYAFNPEVIVILQSIMKLKDRLYAALGSRTSFIQAHADRIHAVWNAIRNRSQAIILQST